MTTHSEDESTEEKKAEQEVVDVELEENKVEQEGEHLFAGGSEEEDEEGGEGDEEEEEEELTRRSNRSKRAQSNTKQTACSGVAGGSKDEDEEAGEEEDDDNDDDREEVTRTRGGSGRTNGLKRAVSRTPDRSEKKSGHKERKKPRNARDYPQILKELDRGQSRGNEIASGITGTGARDLKRFAGRWPAAKKKAKHPLIHSYQALPCATRCTCCLHCRRPRRPSRALGLPI